MGAEPDPEGTRSCPGCGRSVPPERSTCDACGAAMPHELGHNAPPASRSAAPASTNLTAPDALVQRIDRLNEWIRAARPLGLDLPGLPGWAKDSVVQLGFPQTWESTVDRVENETRERCSELLGQLRSRLEARLVRLEAYAIETRLERSQLEAAEQAARLGDLATALWTFPPLDRVVAVKERHLDQAREDLERLFTFVRDLEAIGLHAVDEPTGLASELENELRAGRIAPMRQRLRAVRASAVELLRTALPGYVNKVGDRLVAERDRGLVTESDLRDLALGARQVLEGQPEEGAHLLRRVGAPRGLRVPASAPPKAV